MAGQDALASLIHRLFVWRLVANLNMAASTLYIWDYILTFRMELDLVWKSEWNLMKGLYLFQRYLPFIDTIFLVIYYETGPNLTKTACRNLYFASIVTSEFGLAASEMILVLRAWAVWHRNQRLSIVLPILFVLYWGSSLVVLGRYVNSMIFSDPPYPGFKGCLVLHANKYEIDFLWVSLIFWDAMMSALMLVPGVRTFRDGGQNALAKAVYRNGVIYYLYTFVFSFLNVLIIAIFPSRYQPLLSMVQRVLRSILTSRVLLDIRDQAREDPVWADGLAGLNSGRLHGGETEVDCQEPINFSTRRRSAESP